MHLICPRIPIDQESMVVERNNNKGEKGNRAGQRRKNIYKDKVATSALAAHASKILELIFPNRDVRGTWW